MLHSMTGFARQSSEQETGSLTWEIRAVNHRYLDVQLRLPDEFRPQEAEFRQQVAAVIKRGKIECNLSIRRAAVAQAEIELNSDVVELLGTRISELRHRVANVGSVDPFDLLRWPGVVTQPEFDVGPLLKEASGLLDSALEQMQAMRASEGDRIRQMIESRLADIGRLSADVRQRMPAVLDAARGKQRERLEKLAVDADAGRLEVELALIAQKLDVDEELDRLDSHITEIRDVMARDEPVGRRLDFLMQELNREANTLGSKSGDADTSSVAVELKVLIEQMREQIQNVE